MYVHIILYFQLNTIIDVENNIQIIEIKVNKYDEMQLEYYNTYTHLTFDGNVL